MQDVEKVQPRLLIPFDTVLTGQSRACADLDTISTRSNARNRKTKEMTRKQDRNDRKKRTTTAMDSTLGMEA